MLFSQFTFLLLHSVVASGPSALAASQEDIAQLSIPQVTERLVSLSKSKGATKLTDSRVKGALQHLGQVCAKSLESVPGLTKMLTAYAAVLGSDKEKLSEEQLYLLLSVRDDLRCYLVSQGKTLGDQELCVANLTDIEPLGLCLLFAEGMPYTLGPCNKFLQEAIDRILPSAERAYLAVEEEYFRAFEGEYLSQEPLASSVMRSRSFLKAYPQSFRTPIVCGMVADAEVNLQKLKEGGEDALNSGPGVRCR